MSPARSLAPAIMSLNVLHAWLRVSGRSSGLQSRPHSGISRFYIRGVGRPAQESGSDLTNVAEFYAHMPSGNQIDERLNVQPVSGAIVIQIGARHVVGI